MYYAMLTVIDERNDKYSFSRYPLIKMEDDAVNEYLEFIKHLNYVTNLVITRTNHIHLPREIDLEFNLNGFSNVRYEIRLGTLYYWLTSEHNYFDLREHFLHESFPDPERTSRIERLKEHLESVEEFKKGEKHE